MKIPHNLVDLLRPGDLVLTGGRNFFSEVTQLATRSRFGHVLVVVRGRRLVQATDVALTPVETDEGVFIVSYDEFRLKSGRLSDVRAIRPESVDEGRLSDAAEYLIEHSPTYPSVGAIILGFCCAAARLVAALPPRFKTTVIRHQFRLVADGPTRMHCAEFAVRLYEAAGIKIRFTSPVLDDIIAHSRTERPDLLSMQLECRRARVGVWPDRLGGAAVYGVRTTVATVRERFESSTERDHAGLVLPADLERSPSFRPVFDATRRRGDWHVSLVA